MRTTLEAVALGLLAMTICLIIGALMVQLVKSPPPSSCVDGGLTICLVGTSPLR